MSDIGQEGKVPPEFLKDVVFSSLGADRREVVVHPGQGMDNAVVSLGGRRVLLLTADPLSVIPALGLRESAWLSVHLLASDISGSGVSPQFALFSLNLPVEMDLKSVGAYVRAVSEECKRLGIAIVGGHTGRYPGSGYTVIGGGTMLSVADKGAYVTPAMANPGDAVLITKGAAIGASAVLSHSFPDMIREKAGEAVLRRAKSRLHECSTVRDAKVAASVGLHEVVTSMHDATEGGVLGALSELASAAALPVAAAKEKIHVPEEVADVCRAFGLDPLTTLSEGTLVITCKKGSVEKLQSALERAGIESYEIGQMGLRGQRPGLWLSERGSTPKRHSPAPDRYWNVYAHAAAKAKIA